MHDRDGLIEQREITSGCGLIGESTGPVVHALDRGDSVGVLELEPKVRLFSDTRSQLNLFRREQISLLPRPPFDFSRLASICPAFRSARSLISQAWRSA